VAWHIPLTGVAAATSASIRTSPVPMPEMILEMLVLLVAYSASRGGDYRIREPVAR
jgi:hypothetical protein